MDMNINNISHAHSHTCDHTHAPSASLQSYILQPGGASGKPHDVLMAVFMIR